MPNYSSGGGGGGGSTPAPTPASYGYISAGSASGLAFARHAFSNDAAAMVTVGQVFSGTGTYYGQFGCNSDLAGYVFGGTIGSPPGNQNQNSALIVKLLFSSDSILCQRVN